MRTFHVALGAGLLGVGAVFGAVPATQFEWKGDVPADLQAVQKAIQDLCAAKAPEMIALLDSPGWTPAPRVKFEFKNDMKGTPAAAAGSDIWLSEDWFRTHPGDIGAAVHELCHVFQAYPAPRGPAPGAAGEVKHSKPGWLVEGIADYVRWVRCCPEPNALPTRFARRRYQEGYRTAGTFLDWIQQQTKKDVIGPLNRALREGVYHDGLFKEVSGRTPDEWWTLLQAERP